MTTIILSKKEIELVKELKMLSEMSITDRYKWLRENEGCSGYDDVIIHEYIGLMQALVVDISVALESKGVNMKDGDIKGGFLLCYCKQVATLNLSYVDEFSEDFG